MRDTYVQLNEAGLSAVGINADSLDSHVNYCQSLKLPFPLLYDPDLAVTRQYGVLKPDGLSTERTVMVVDSNQVVVYRQKGAPSASEIIEGVHAYIQKS